MRFFRLQKLDKWVIWIGLVIMVVMTLLRIIFYFSFNNLGNSLSGMGPAFLLGFRFDARTASLLVLPLLLLGQFSFLNPFKSNKAKKGWMFYWSIIALLIIFFYVIDFAHYAYLSQRLNASVLNYLQDAGISMDMVWQSYPVLRLIFLILAGSFLFAWGIIIGFRKISRTSSSPDGKRRLFIVILIPLVCFAVFGRFNQYPLRWSDAFGLGNDYKANFSLNPFESFFNTLKFRSTTYDEKKVKEMYPVLAGYFNFNPASPLNFSRTETGSRNNAMPAPNVILVICESFSGYKSSMWNNPLQTTPFFDSLSRKGVFFDHCFSPSYGTARGVWATLTGIPDVEMPNTSSRNPLAVDQHIIMNDFSGYEKYYFIGGSPSWANIRGLLMNNIKGLHIYDQEVLDAPRLDVWGISDKNLFLESNKILSRESKPFFAIIQSADNHRPYTIPAEDNDFVIRIPTEDSLNKFGFKDQISYDLKLKEYNAFRYTDFTFQKFISAASREKYFSNTIFIFIGDHGIAGDAGEMFSRAWTAQRLTSEHVPLLFYSPRLPDSKRLSTICSQVDVMPTIAGLCAVSYTNSTLGRNLLDSNHHTPFAFIFDPDQRQAGVVIGDYYYRKHLQTGKEELVSIKNNNRPDTTAILNPTKEEMKKLSDAFYEASRYLLLNNKKKTITSN